MYNKKENKLYAEKHEAMINKLFQTQIKASIDSSVIYNPDSFKDVKTDFSDHAEQLVWESATDQAAIKAFRKFRKQKIAAFFDVS